MENSHILLYYFQKGNVVQVYKENYLMYYIYDQEALKPRPVSFMKKVFGHSIEKSIFNFKLHILLSNHIYYTILYNIIL